MENGTKVTIVDKGCAFHGYKGTIEKHDSFYCIKGETSTLVMPLKVKLSFWDKIKQIFI